MYLKKNIIGYAALLVLCFLIFFTDMFYIFIPLVLLFFVTDIISGFSRKWLPFMPGIIVLLLLYAMIIGVFTYFIFKIAPFFMSDTSHYMSHIQESTKQLVESISKKYNLDLNILYIREQLVEQITKSLGHALKIFNDVTKSIVFFIFALILNFLLFSEGDKIRVVFASKEKSLLSYIYFFLSVRIIRFYSYLKKVMLGQIIISLINTLITVILIFSLNLPYKFTLIILVFMFGLIPVIGNLISNSILAVTTLVSTGLFPALFCVVYLVVIHKLEYFLNSKIIGTMIRLPMFVILFTIILGEVLFGILGIIIAVPLLLAVKQEFDEITYESI